MKLDLETYTHNSETKKNLWWKKLLSWCQNTLCPVSSRNIIKTFRKFSGDRLLAAREKYRKHSLLDPDELCKSSVTF